MKKMLVSALPAITCTWLLAGCGLADVGATAATTGASAAEQAKQAKEMEDKVQKQLDAAQKAAADQRAATDANN